MSPSAFDRVLDGVGSAIVRGALGPTTTVEAPGERTGASRSIVREATRVLGSLGLLSAGPRVGLRVRAAEDWDVLDPLVIRWRLAGPDRAAALDDLRALRRAVEPAAAAAAARMGADGADAARRVAEAIRASRPETWVAADRDLHALVLRLSGNAMFRRLGAVIDEALADRSAVDPDPHDVGLHAAVADAIAAADPAAAADAMREIVDRTT
jgi:DNA-binding FadR family transcriptional regulator